MSRQQKLLHGYSFFRSAPASPTHGMMMQPPLKQANSRPESVSEEEQNKPFLLAQQNGKGMPQLVHRANSDGALLVTDPSEISAVPMPIHQTNNIERSSNTVAGAPPALHPIKSATTFKGVTPIVAGQPGSHSVFFTSAKLVTQTIPGQVVKAGSPTTAQASLMMQPNALKALSGDKQTIRPNGAAPTAQQPPTILFRPTGQPVAGLPSQQGSQQNIKTVSPIIANGQMINTHANILFTQTLDKTNIRAGDKLPAPATLLAASSDIVATLMPSTLQTVSVIKQPNPSVIGDMSLKETKPFTSITDILSSKQNTEKGGFIFIILFS